MHATSSTRGRTCAGCGTSIRLGKGLQVSCYPEIDYPLGTQPEPIRKVEGGRLAGAGGDSGATSWPSIGETARAG